MKKNILFAAIAMICSQFISAQTTVKLKFNQKLGTNGFTFNTQNTNNIGETYTITRLQYYISDLIIIHDSGKLDTFNGKHLLIDPSKDTAAITLGDITLINIEAIQFSIGVDKAVNHLDPSQYASSNPLAPKSPSMNWGWSPGYRFLAIEGKTGNNLNLVYELHGLGDQNYFSLRIPVTATDDNGSKLITLNADYSQVLKNISVKNGVVAHGDNTVDVVALANMRDNVFTSLTGQGDILKNAKPLFKNELVFYPNPLKVGEKMSIQNQEKYTFTVYNACGKLVKSLSSEKIELELNETGFYQIIATDLKGNLIASSKLMVQ